MSSHNDAAVLASWSRNADPWVTAVRENEIASRVLVTNAAIVEAVRARHPRTAVDLGCGEGWLVRALPEVRMVGVDAVPELVEAARLAGGGEFRQLSYEQIAAGELDLAVDLAVCNFSLIGKEAVDGLFRAAPTYLRRGGALVVQTVHPLASCGDAAYRMAGAAAAGPASTAVSPTRRRGISERYQAGSACSRPTACAPWRCASRCIPRPASRCP